MTQSQALPKVRDDVRRGLRSWHPSGPFGADTNGTLVPSHLGDVPSRGRLVGLHKGRCGASRRHGALRAVHSGSTGSL